MKFNRFLKIKNSLLLLVLSFSTIVHAQDLPTQAAEAEFDRQRDATYQQLGISQIVPAQAFNEAYAGYYYYKAQGKLSAVPLLTFVNFAISSKSNRFVIVDLEAKSVAMTTQVAHGKNTSKDEGRYRDIAAYFANVDNSLKSSLGFYITGEQYESPKFGKYALRLDGLSGVWNDKVRPRAIVIHSADYVQSGGRSYGCLALMPGETIKKAVTLLKNKTLIYAFNTETMVSVDNKATAVIAAAKEPPAAPVPDVSAIKDPPPTETQKTIEEAPPAIADAGGAAAKGVTILEGSPKYETCQGLSNKSWKDTTADINAGKDPSPLFRGSWKLLRKEAQDKELDNDEAIQLSQERLSTINDCVAVAHISTQTDFNKPNINTPESKSSSDGKIKCVYNGPESQDYATCVQSIVAYEALNLREKNLHADQAKDYTTSAKAKVGSLNIDNTQGVSLDNVKELQSEHSSIALARAEISTEKLNFLQAVASKIPTTDSLYDECKDKFNKHGVVSKNEYNEFIKIYGEMPIQYNVQKDYCLAAVSNEVKPLHNEIARGQIKEVLKSFGKDAEDYKSKSSALLNQGSILMPGSETMNMQLSAISNKGGLSNFDSPMNYDVFDSSYSGGSNSGSGRNARRPDGNFALPNFKGNSSGVANNSRMNFNSNNGNSSTSGSGSLVESASGTGIYDADFYTKIRMALADPSKLEELKLTEEQLKEYNSQKEYRDSLRPENSRAIASSASPSEDEATPAVKELDIHPKDSSIFEIISSRYKEVFRAE